MGWWKPGSRRFPDGVSARRANPTLGLAGGFGLVVHETDNGVERNFADRQMDRIRSRITSRGRVSIPARIRRKLGLTPGSTVEWCERGSEVLVRRATKYSSLDIHQVVFPSPPEPKSVEAMDVGVGIHLRCRHSRS